MTVPETSAAETTAPRRRRVELMSLFLCFILVLIFYYPSLLSSSKDAGYLYTGDIVGFYAPMIMKVHSLVRHLQLTGLDFHSTTVAPISSCPRTSSPFTRSSFSIRF